MSNNNLVKLAKARIEMLFAAGRAGIRLEDFVTLDSAVMQLRSSSQDITVPAEVRDEAAARHDELGLERMDEGLAKLEEIVRGMDSATDDLKKAVVIATKGKDALTVPAVAHAAEKALSSLEKLKKSADKTKDDLQAVLDSKNVGDATERLRDLMTDLEALSVTLQGKTAT